jgi:DNA-binding response OmpR family regulator
MSGRKKVLLVEDDESIRSLVRVNLQLADYDVVEARDGLEGLLLLDLYRPDAVILDLMMPEVDGERMLAQLRASPEVGHVPVLIITGKPNVSGEVSRLAGDGNVFSKPFDPEALIARLSQLTGG